MREELDAKLCRDFPLLYSDPSWDKPGPAQTWGFECGDGWFDLIYELSSKLESEIKVYLAKYPATCVCRDEKSKHLEGKGCQRITPPNAFAKEAYECVCTEFHLSHPRASQVKEKYAVLRYYLSAGTEAMYALIDKYEKKSKKICESCGDIGQIRDDLGWYSTLCLLCYASRL